MFYKNLFYFDIETVGQYKDFTDFQNADERGAELFKKKFEKNPFMSERHETLESAYLEYAGIFSTYGKIVCISFGFFNQRSNDEYIIRSIYGHDQEQIIKEFNKLLYGAAQKHLYLCGYRITSFDIPWVLHKINKYGLIPSKNIDIYGTKPWDNKIVDLAEDWKQKFKYFNTFDEVAYELDVESPKDDIDGSMVHNIYWNNNDLERIKTYCEKDVKASMKVAKKMFEHRL